MNEDEFDSEENDDFAKDMKDKLSKYPIIGGLVNTYSNSGLKGCIDKINPFSEKLHFFGRVSIFVTGLRHGCGCTYITGSLATTMANELKEIICVCHRQGTNLPSMSRIKEYTGDTDFDRAYQGKVVIYDRGILGEFTQEEMIEMRRADIRLLVCNGEESDIQRLARFIHKAGDSAKDWMYVFNLVPNQWRMVKIRELMHDYNIIFIPLHDYTHIPVKVKKEWIKKINSAKKTS